MGKKPTKSRTIQKLNFSPSEPQKQALKGYNEKAYFVDKKGIKSDIPAKSDYLFGIPNLAGKNLTQVLVDTASVYGLEFNVKTPSSSKNEAQIAIDKMKELGVWSKMTSEMKAPLTKAANIRDEGKLSQVDRSILIFSLMSKLEKLSPNEQAFFKAQVKFLSQNMKVPVKKAPQS